MPEPLQPIPEHSPATEAFGNSVDGILLEQFGIENTQATQTEIHDGEMGMPQLDTDTFAGQIFWLIVSFGILYILISRSALPRIHEVMDKRKHRISRDLDRAEILSDEARQAKQNYETLQAQARNKSSALIHSTQSDIIKAQENAYAEVDADILNLMQQSDAQIKDKQLAFKQDLTQLSESLANALIEEITGTKAANAVVESAVAAKT